jgi:hypothetical protein
MCKRKLSTIWTPHEEPYMLGSADFSTEISFSHSSFTTKKQHPLEPSLAQVVNGDVLGVAIFRADTRPPRIAALEKWIIFIDSQPLISDLLQP